MCVRAGEEGAVRALEDVHVFGLCAFLGGGGTLMDVRVWWRGTCTEGCACAQGGVHKKM